MASIVTNTGSMVFKMDTGEMVGSKTIYKNVSLAGVKGSASAEVLADIATKLQLVLPGAVEQVALRRTETLVF